MSSHSNDLHQADPKSESLMTRKALQLSLSPPRCPPFGTAHRSVLIGVRPLDNPYAEHHEDVAHSYYNLHCSIRERLMHLIYGSRLIGRHPHLMVGPEGADQITRFLGSLLPLAWQNHVRDSGGFRSIFDNVVECSIPVCAVTNPRALISFLRLSRKRRVIRYGLHHEAQFIDMYFPEEGDQDRWTGMVFFVHGGAWGSGKPWYYRLVAQAFLNLNMAVAIVGYRVYPDGDTAVQVADLGAAQLELTRQFPDLCGPNRKKRSIGFCVMGHSSGAHISMLLIVEQAKRLFQVEQKRLEMRDYEQQIDHSMKSLTDAFIGISGPYDISHHFDYEAARGVEELSPMKACNGYSRENLRFNSPAHRLQDFLTTFQEGSARLSPLSSYFPKRMLLLHGIEDDTVPFTQTGDAARILRSCGIEKCQEMYVPLTGHQDAVIQLMLGGRVREVVRSWLSYPDRDFAQLRSRL